MSLYKGSEVRKTVYCSRCACEVANHRAPLTLKQSAMLDFIAAHITEHGYAPSFPEIAAARGYRSLATVHEHLCSLERKGYIVRGYNESRSITLVAA
ncbi:MAG: lexA [Gemmatimonadetes bacterium]|nr:lexA [Gemmatimonadota bacterium]